MGLFNYKIKVECGNCGDLSIVRIPNGKTILEFLKQKKGKCNYCKCKCFAKYYKKEKED